MIESVILTMSIMMSSMFIFTTHPLIMGAILMMQTITNCLIINLIQKSNWIAFVVFILIMGNMVILFLVLVVSLASNEIISPNFPQSAGLLLLIILSSMIMSKNWIMKNPNEVIFNSSITQLSTDESTSLAKLFHQSMLSIIIILMMILFFYLCSTISIITLHEGPMRTMN